jgi:hypothetical protein
MVPEKDDPFGGERLQVSRPQKNHLLPFLGQKS